MIVWKIRNNETNEYLYRYGEKGSMWDRIGTTWSSYDEVMAFLRRFTPPENASLVQFKAIELSERKVEDELRRGGQE